MAISDSVLARQRAELAARMAANAARAQQGTLDLGEVPEGAQGGPVDPAAMPAALQRIPRARAALVPLRHVHRDFFLCDLFDYAIKDDGVTMEAPIFTLATKPDLSIWEWTAKDGTRSVTVTPSVKGRATQHDKDVLIYVISQLKEGMNQGRADAENRTVRLTAYNYLVATNRNTDGDAYEAFSDSLERLGGTRLKTNIKTGGKTTRDMFGLIERAHIVLVETKGGKDRMVAVEVTISEWLYNAVKSNEVLTLHPDYFRLRKPLERRIYELARKHCGHQAGWAIGLDLLRDKAGSKSPLNEFRRMVGKIIEADTTPSYQMLISEGDMVSFTTRDPVKLAKARLEKLKQIKIAAPLRRLKAIARDRVKHSKKQ